MITINNSLFSNNRYSKIHCFYASKEYMLKHVCTESINIIYVQLYANYYVKQILSNIISLIPFHIAPAPKMILQFARHPAAHPIGWRVSQEKGTSDRTTGLFSSPQRGLSPRILGGGCLGYVQDQRKCYYIASNRIKMRSGHQSCSCRRWGHQDYIYQDKKEMGVQWGSSVVILSEAMAFKQVWTFSSCPLSLTPRLSFISLSLSWPLTLSPIPTSGLWTEPSALLLLSGLGAEEEGGECIIWMPPIGTTGSRLQACCWECRGRWLRMFWWWELAAAGRLEVGALLWSWKDILAGLAVRSLPGSSLLLESVV